MELLCRAEGRRCGEGGVGGDGFDEPHERAGGVPQGRVDHAAEVVSREAVAFDGLDVFEWVLGNFGSNS